tara:strand:- start:309 stop:689 length:381 start_codon:yes stop_codon:yes gene_type:complete
MNQHINKKQKKCDKYCDCKICKYIFSIVSKDYDHDIYKIDHNIRFSNTLTLINGSLFAWNRQWPLTEVSPPMKEKYAYQEWTIDGETHTAWGLQTKWGHFKRKYIINNFCSPYIRLCHALIDNDYY